MKKMSCLFIALCMSISLNVLAAQDKIFVTLDGQEIQFDVQPQIISDFTMVPMRAIFESLGYEVEWYDATRAISAVNTEGNMIEMIIDNPYMYVGNDADGFERIALEIAPQIVDERTLVPVRAIAEAHGCKVDWDGDSKTVIIQNKVVYYAGTDIPDIKSIVPDAELVTITETEDNTPIYVYKLDDTVLAEYLNRMEAQYGFICLEDSPTSFTMCPKEIAGYSVSVDVIEESGIFALMPWEYELPGGTELSGDDAETIVDILKRL